MVYAYNGILSSLIKKWYVATWINYEDTVLNEIIDKNVQILYELIYVRYAVVKFIEIEGRMLVAMGSEDGESL